MLPSVILAANEKTTQRPRHSRDADSQATALVLEIVDAVVSILDAPARRSRGSATMGWPRPRTTIIAAEFLESIRTGLALKGPLATPVGGGYRSVNVRLREEFGLYANLAGAHPRARRALRGHRHRPRARELEGLYVGLGALPRIGRRSARGGDLLGRNTRAECRRGSPSSPSTTPSGTSAARSSSCTRPTSSRP